MCSQPCCTTQLCMPVWIYALKCGRAAASVGIVAKKHPEFCVSNLALTVALMFALHVSEFPRCTTWPSSDPGSCQRMGQPRAALPKAIRGARAPSRGARRHRQTGKTASAPHPAPGRGKARPQPRSEMGEVCFSKAALELTAVHITAMRTEQLPLQGSELDSLHTRI